MLISAIRRTDRLISNLENALGRSAVYKSHPDDIWSGIDMERTKSLVYVNIYIYKYITY
jgi:hypothetical protein